MYIYNQRLTDVLATCLIFCSRVTTFTCFCFVFGMYEHVKKKRTLVLLCCFMAQIVNNVNLKQTVFTKE